MDTLLARTFIAAAEAGSFAAASARLHASPSAVTERIKQLEHLLGVRLFERDKRGCRLTQAGERFVEPAQAMIRAWETGLARVGLPGRYRHAIRIGGQHALWPSLLIPWLNAVTGDLPEIAIRASAASPAQLNRGLREGELDIALLYDPSLRNGIRLTELAPDRLVLVTARPERDWREIFVQFDWGENANARLRAQMDHWPQGGLELDLGILALEWLTSTGSAGFVPAGMARRHLREGRLTIVPGLPSIDFSPFICWRTTLEPEIVGPLVALARVHADQLSRA